MKLTPKMYIRTYVPKTKHLTYILVTMPIKIAITWCMDM